MKKTVLALLFSISSLFAGEINIAVAANVSYAMDELKAEFAKISPQTKVQVTLGSSGKLVAQIKNGAPYGVFMSANMKFPEALFTDGLTAAKPVVYAQGSLAYLSAKKQDFSQGVNILISSNINKIAVANPTTAPYGKAAVEAMQKAGIYDKVKDKFVYAESISQVVTYSISAADIGFVAKSSLYSPKMAQYKEGINYAEVDPKLYTPIKQGIVLMKNEENNKEYKAFYNFILSEKAKAIFKKYGYII
ncbi:MAG: molybdate ABC transporter substrate-binding protein [Thiovulaceae bacterium]|nr:molybdate ABC transporter substrate-binding protein [Sulfurimonadaceae bacterium]